MTSKFSKASVYIALALLASIFISACGGSNQVPANATVVISPAEKPFERTVTVNGGAIVLDNDGLCPIGEIIQDDLIVIRVLDSSGVAITNADITVSLNFSANTSNVVVLELYEDRNGDQVPDLDELVSGVGDPLLQTTTSSSSGEKSLIVRSFYGCFEYIGTLTVAASAAVGVATFSYDLTVEEPEQDDSI